MRKLGFNQFDLTFNFPFINRDFIILQIVKDEGWLTYNEVNELDAFLTNEKCKALSVCFPGGSKAFVLYRKKEFGNTIATNLLQSTIEGSETLRAEVAKAKEIASYKLFQLFLNACNNSDNSRFRYNNLTGRLFITSPEKGFENKKDKSRMALEVKVKYDNILSLQTTTFTSLSRHKDLILDEFGKPNTKRRKRVYGKSPRYLFDQANNTFRRSFNKDDSWEDLYLQMRPLAKHLIRSTKKKNLISFLSLNPQKYLSSKIGIFATLLLEDFQRIFEKYIEVKQRIIGEQKIKSYKTNKVQFDAITHVPIYLIDNVGHSNISEKVITLCRDEFGLIPKIVNKVQAEGINLCLNEEREVYENVGSDDPYKNSTLDCPIQNFTIQEFQAKKVHQLRKTLFEAQIKYDISQNRLSVFNWKNLTFEHDWHFATADQDEDSGELSFYFLKISPKGDLSFQVTDAELTDNTLYNQMKSAFEDSFDRKGKVSIEGIVCDGKKNLNTITKTELFTTPELIHLHTRLMNGTDLKGEFLSKKELLDFTKRFIEGNESNVQLDKALALLENFTESQISLEEYQTYFKGKGSRPMTNLYVIYFWESYGFWLKNLTKNKEVTAEAFGSMVDLHLYTRDKKAYFWANKNMGETKGEFNKTNVVRCLKTYGNSYLLHNKLLDMMDVDFVRIGAPTVIPFPFKFLREYQKMVGKRSDNSVKTMNLNFNL